MASIPTILLFASILATLLTGIFVLEAFVTHLYKGPGHKIIVSFFVAPFVKFAEMRS